MAEPNVRATRYEVSCLLPDHIDVDLFTIAVEWRGKDRWAVLLRGHWALGTDGEWSREPIPSYREDDWLASHRFGLDEALKLAKREAPKVIVNGLTVADVLAKAATDA